MQQIDDLFEIVTCVELYLINMNCKLWIIYIYIYMDIRVQWNIFEKNNSIPFLYFLSIYFTIRIKLKFHFQLK